MPIDRRIYARSTKLGNQDLLLDGPRKEEYYEYGAPLYNASIQGDWKLAKAILDKKPELVRYCLTFQGETALHVAASANSSKQVVEFVKNLVGFMEKEDLELQNITANTALYTAAAAGNIETIKIMVGKNRALLTIPGVYGTSMPLHAAALHGNEDVVRYLYELSNDLGGDGWNDQNRGYLLEKCVESDMFDIALDITKKHPTLGRSNAILRVLARKPEALSKTKSSIIKGIVNSVCAFIGLKVEMPEKESQALQLLRIIWEDIVKLHKKEIDEKLRGPPDRMKSTDGWPLQVIQLEELLSVQLEELEKNSSERT